MGKKVISGLITLLIIISLNFAIQIKISEAETTKRNILIPPMKLVGSSARKLWEGKIDGRSVTYFRSEKEGGAIDIIVVTQDNLPKYFKRIQYFDEDRDGNLDFLQMKIYEMAKGWRDVGVTKDNKYGLEYANSHYRELLIKIEKAGEAMK